MKSKEIILFNHQKNSANTKVGSKKKKKIERVPASPVVIVKDEQGERHIKANEVSPVLFRLKGIWPFDLYQDELIIEEKKIILKYNSFPFFTSITTIPLAQIGIFDVNHSYLFSSLSIKGISSPTIFKFSWLKSKDAQRAKKIIDGLMMKEKEKIVIVDTDTKQRALALEMIGQM